MIAALLPFDEAQRLETLKDYDAIQNLPEEAFDDLTLIAAQICGVPIAMVSLVDDKRQWFKSRRGIKIADTSREVAFCAHTILHKENVLEVRDARLDPRFSDSPLVTEEESIRFYAGAPLVAPNGSALGALCVMDRVPRSLTDEQTSALRALSRRVIAQLELLRHARRMVGVEKETSRLLTGADQSRRALLSLLEDQKLTESALRASQERFRQIAETINEVFWMTDVLKQQILYISPAYEKIWGRTCESLYASHAEWVDSVHPEDRPRLSAAARGEMAVDESFRIVRPDGAVRWIHSRTFPVRDKAGVPTRVVGVAEDITERKAIELREELQHTITRVFAEADPLPEAARHFLDIVGRALGWSVGSLWTVDPSATLLICAEAWSVSPATYAPFVGQTRAQVLHSGESLPGRVWASNHPLWIPEISQDPKFLRSLAGVQVGLRAAVAFPITLRQETIGVVEFFSTEARWPDPEVLETFAALGAQMGQYMERQELAKQFRQTQKMEAIGTLAGGIAHDFNNVLAAINGYTELAKMETEGNATVTEYLDAVMHGSRRATDLVRQILTFSRQQEPERVPIQLQGVVAEVLKLLRATMPTTIAFETSLPPETHPVLADASQIHQIVMNLCSNAAHAMRDRPGRLTVGLEDVRVDAGMVAAHPHLRAGAYVRLSVTDTGHGMDEATQSRIFEPFFTTKAPGEGTGLGLAVVHGIMQSHDGAILVHSHLGQGTTFQLYFPALAGTETEDEAAIRELRTGHGERILFVDDEEPLANLGKRVLERLGYWVDAKFGPKEALAAVQAAPQGYDLVVTDQTMPGMTGTVLAQHIHALRPDLPIILATGYSASLTPQTVEAFGIQKLILKPHSVESLASVIAQVLAETKAG